MRRLTRPRMSEGPRAVTGSSFYARLTGSASARSRGARGRSNRGGGSGESGPLLKIVPARRDQANSSDLTIPSLASRNLNPTLRQPKPYFTLRRKLMEEASLKYFVGQLTSPIVKP